MLIEFTVGNYLSFKDPMTFSMVAAPIKEHQDNNTFPVSDNLKLLKSSVIYGANASGKSNFIKAISFMKRFIINSSKETQANELIAVKNFKLSSETEDQPSHFEIIFIYEEVRYRYGFEVDTTKVHREWLFHAPKGKEALLFTREFNKIELGTHFSDEGKGLESKTRDNALFLSVVAQFNGQIAIKILKWFRRFNIISGLNDDSYLDYTVNKLNNTAEKGQILEFLKIADLGITDITAEKSKVTFDNLPKNIPEEIKQLFLSNDDSFSINVSTLHKKYDKNKQFSVVENFDLETNESEGTKKIFCLSGPLINTLKNGNILVIDELDSRLHPLITRFIVKMFNSKETNAQLIFATHDTNLLNKNIFRRDQIWFVEKDIYGATDLYSLVEYKTEESAKVRNDASFEKDYILGKYGAIPFIGDYSALFGEKDAEE
jgi:AAA15 family ATPase/GTPase